MVLVKSEFAGDACRSILAVAGEHYAAADSLGLDVGNRLSRVVLDLVGDVDVTGILAVHGHVHHSPPSGMAALPGGTHLIHQAVVANCHPMAVDRGKHAVAGLLGNVSHGAAVVITGIGIAKRGRDGVRGVVLHMSGQVEELLFGQMRRVDRGDLEDALGERARLVEDNGLRLCQSLEVVRPLHEDAVLGGAADATKEREGHREDQRTGARDHEEGESAQEPLGEVGAKVTRDERRKHSHCNGQVDHDGRIDLGKALDELLGAGLIGAGILDHVDDLACRGLAKGLGHAQAKHAGKVHAARERSLAGLDGARHGLAGDGAGVEA